MQQTWQLQEAKNKLSRVVTDAIQEGPQVITRHGVEVAIVLSMSEYRKLVAPRQKLSQFFRESPLRGLELDLSRDDSPQRDDLDL
uniref:Antitoxin n=1 Tax=uncultured bacterium A1Q1_fos_1246 TaxID=1256545 RepID=L7VZA1_9BACT|nr:prevent-host-death family protein [uncultured bacterium A1Q1_fos_1246]